MNPHQHLRLSNLTHTTQGLSPESLALGLGPQPGREWGLPFERISHLSQLLTNRVVQ